MAYFVVKNSGGNYMYYDTISVITLSHTFFVDDSDA